MSFLNIPHIKIEYKTLKDEVVSDFYLPCLKEAFIYKRAVGFFSSTILLQISQGLASIASRGGRIQLLVSPRLEKEDYEAIKKGYKLRERIYERMIEDFDEDIDFFQKEERFALLAKLIAERTLDIKVLCIKNDYLKSMYHEKLGILIDENDNKVVFTGSANETYNGFNSNYEAIDVFCSWKSEESLLRCENKDMRFDMMWNGTEDTLITIPFPEVIKNKILKYSRNDIDFLQLDEKLSYKLNSIKRKLKDMPSYKDISLFSYQKEAILNWTNNNYRGIYDMATGTGKTFTGLGSIVSLYEDKKRLAVIICCPYIHLVDQWAEEAAFFNINPIVCYSARKYKEILIRNIRRFTGKMTDFICIIVSNGTFKTDSFQNLIKPIINQSLLVVDEAHNFGATKLSKYMFPQYPYRLALSATLDRYGDEEGTKKLYDFFGNKCIEYSLEQAIIERKLTPYKYYPIIVNLTELELEEYQDLTYKIQKFHVDDEDDLPEALKKLLIQRARLVAGARNKVNVLKSILAKSYTDKYNILIYCGAVRYDVTSDKDEEGVKQIEQVSKMLNEDLKIKSYRFTAEEDPKTRRSILEGYKNEKIQAIVAIKCLDEGMNIPAIKTAFILASSTNPKEYIQRRGRVLRKSPNKEYAEIYDFITLPRRLDEAQSLDSEEKRIDISLVKKELARLKDFSQLSMNPHEANEIIEEIKNSYDLYNIDESELKGYE